MILLWGTGDDEQVTAVRRALEDKGADIVVVDPCLALAYDVGGPPELPSVTAAYLRPGEVDAGAHAAHVHRLTAALAAWAETTQALVVHRPSVVGENASKPYQLALIERHSPFAVPRTLVTTSPEAAAAFVGEHGTVVAKSVSHHRSTVWRLTEADVARLDGVRWVPTQLQAWVPGVDWRVHVVDGEVAHSCMLEAADGTDDYRVDPATRVVERPVPEEVAKACLALVGTLGLLVAGVDLRLAPDGRWHCFEVNPAPAFTYFDRGPGHPVAEAVARLLLTA